MNPTEEQKEAAREFYRKKRAGFVFSADMKTTMAHAHEEDELASLIASREQQAAENAARAVRDKVLALPCEGSGDGFDEGFCECCDNRMEAATSAAAPFLNPKGE